MLAAFFKLELLVDVPASFKRLTASYIYVDMTPLDTGIQYLVMYFEHFCVKGICEKTNTVGQALQSSRCTAPETAKQNVAQGDDDSVSEKAYSSQGKRKILQHRSSRPESLRSNKVSSAGSQGRGEKLSRLKPDAIINEQNEGSDVIATEDPSRRLFTFELYNTVLYGLPNFTTTLQSGGS